MIDLKLPKKSEAERKKEMDATIGSVQEQYPWGLILELDNDTVKKLGIEEIDADQPVSIKAVGSVKSKTVDERQGGEKSYRVSIQIKKMEVEGGNVMDKIGTDEFMKSRNKKGGK